MRHSEKTGCNRYAATVVNYLTAIIIGFITIGDKALLIPSGQNVYVILFAMLNGVLFVASLVYMQISVNKNGAALTAMFSRLGSVVPVILSVFLFSEIPGITQIIGLVIVVLAIVLINADKAEKGRLSIVTLIVIFVVGGVVSVISKLFTMNFETVYEDVFIFYTFASAFIASIVLTLVKNRSMQKKDIVAGVLIGVPNQLSSLFLLKAVNVLPTYIVFPVNSASIILLVSVIGFVVFKEKLSKLQIVSGVLIGVALLLINIS